MILHKGALALTIVLTTGCGRCNNQQQLPQPSTDPVSFALSGSPDMYTACAGLQAVEEGLSNSPGIERVAIEETSGMRITVDLEADKLSLMGVTVQSVENALIDYLGVDKSILSRDGNEISMTFGSCEQPPFQIEEMISISVKDSSGNMLPISHMGTVSYSTTDDGAEKRGGTSARITVTPSSPTTPEEIEVMMQGFIDEAVPGTDLKVDPI